MTTVSPTADTPRLDPAAFRVSYPRQIAIMVKRSATHTRRMPEMLIDVTAQPIVFVLLFAFVFGASITVPGGFDYRGWMLPGIIAQTIAFAAFIVATGITGDIEKGIIDRFRSLPIARSAVLVGRSVTGLAHESIAVVIVAITGLIIGWRVNTDPLSGLAGFALVLLFGFAMVWVGILVGSVMRTAESVEGLLFASLFPFTFLANSFVPTEPMPSWIRAIAEWNPVSSLVQSLRELWGNGGLAPADAQLPLHYPILSILLWSALIIAVFAPLSLRAYYRRTER
ncbi:MULTISPECIES: ABC transporter permease [unclassified Crossiella]|uniref:ABC transporter permease n=1 Tax=unclassified Crossiella TaxID=2620835 RepID=UPI001FFF3D4E|nr:MULTISPECIES: ABC transporter permease [unclassified Crossiella]MCK2244569.1 ABC transporter permease [Crossiella sp. S99.2]MCK2258200.1 ABC transporter permease [Crossiella sp. S99.1]